MKQVHALFVWNKTGTQTVFFRKGVVMKSRSLFALVLLFAAACSSMLTPTPSDSGIEGNVTIGPTCPVMQINDPCPDKPYQAILTILTTTDRSTVLKFQTDANGQFHVALAPGTYILHPESPNAMPHAAEIPFTVTGHEFTHLEVSYDSGIR